jgi:hypothetical protein
MANSYTGNVQFVDTTGTTLAFISNVCGVKYIGNASGTATIKAGSTSGAVVWEESGASNVFNQVDFRCSDGLYVTLTNGAKIYIYFE